MKQNLNIADLNDLTESQKQTLRDYWMPEENDLVVAYICKNVETEEYDEIVFVVGDVLVEEERRHNGVTLRRLRLLDDSFYEENRQLFENEGSYDMEYCEPEEYFSKADCLPLLSIGQLIDLLRKTKFGRDGFNIEIPALGDQLIDEAFILNARYYDNYDGNELCDVLWAALKAML